MQLRDKLLVQNATRVFIAPMYHWQVLCRVLMELIQTLWDKHNVSCVLQEITVHLHLKENNHARMEHTVRMGRLFVLSVRVDTGELWTCKYFIEGEGGG